MGRPEPCVLFAQTFSHPQLDEYVDEVLFSEPVVITACEFLEQNVSSACQSVPIVGATSPPSFALEVFVQCESEARFRRLCQPFLYSHSSSSVLEVEGVVTNHLVVRGSYRGLSLVIYGNTAEDLGQFNIEFDDSSLTNIVTSVEGNLEDLPLPLRTSTSANKELGRVLSGLTLPLPSLDVSAEIKQLLRLVFRILDKPKSGDAVHKAINILQSVVASFVANDLCGTVVNQKPISMVKSTNCEELLPAITDAVAELRKLLEDLHELTEDKAFFEFDDELASSRQLVDLFGQYFHSENWSTCPSSISRSKNAILSLSMALLLCSGKESCLHFVNGGGIEDLHQIFSSDLRDSATVVLLLLGVMEQATRHSIGCEGILGWWPRKGEGVPLSFSECYTELLKLLLQKQRHDIASLSTHVLHRLRFYEVVSRYECAVLSVLRDMSSVNLGSDGTVKALKDVMSHIKTLVKLVNLRGPIEDPSPIGRGSKAILAQGEGVIGSLISSSYCLPIAWDNDPYLLVLLKDRGFFPLSAALLSSSMLRSTAGNSMHLIMEIVADIWAILLSLLFSRSGLIFLAQQTDLCSTLIPILRGLDSSPMDECLPLHYAFVLLSKGFLCKPQEIGMILEKHLRVVYAMDQMLSSSPQSEEFLWVLWELCALSRIDCGRQAVLAFEYFPEAISALIGALHLVKESESVTSSGGASPLDVAIFHSVAEIFEIIVCHPTASSLGSWIGHAVELHKALNSSSPGSNRKDAPTRLLEWIDAGVVYQKHGAVGLLRYAAVMASGGDAHLTSASSLVSDVMDVEHAFGESSGSADANVIENLGKIILEKTFDGVTLRDSSVTQLTTAFRILALISEDSAVAVALYDEGAITIIYAVLVNCRFMLERASNNYDYLVDDVTECNSTSDVLMERNREQSLIELLFPSLVLLINLLQKLQEANEQYRNTKLVNALLRLHRELSPKLAACVADLSYLYPDSTLRYEGVCHLIVSALAFWPVYGWTPGLFHSLLTSVQVTSQLALGPKETCSFMCLLNDLCLEEDVWKWKNGMPMFSILRSLAIRTILGPKKEEEVNWYLKSEHVEKVLKQLEPQLEKISQMIQHYVVSGLAVIQDILRVFLVRIACLKAENASLLLKPILSSVLDCISEVSFSSETDNYKVLRYLDFIASLLEHPQAKALLLKEGVVHIVQKAMCKCLQAVDPERKHTLDGRGAAGDGFTISIWCVPICKALSLLNDSKTSAQAPGQHKLDNLGSLSAEDSALVMPSLLEFLKVLPVGQELLTCVRAFKDLSCHKEGQNSLIAALDTCSTTQLLESEIVDHNNQIGSEMESGWRKSPPLLCCWRKFWGFLDSMDEFSVLSVDGINMLSSASLSFCFDGKSVDMKAVAAVKFLFGLSEENKEDANFEETFQLFKAISSTANNTSASKFSQMSDSAKLLSSLLLSANDAEIIDNQIFQHTVDSLWNKDPPASVISVAAVGNDGHDDILQFGSLHEKFVWECPETLPDKGSLSLKRKLPASDVPGRRGRGDNAPNDPATSTAFSRGSGPSAPSSGPTRRDNFRLRKPNTSRPPSMHVDDYVARERNIDGANDVIAVPRVGSSSGRPPSIHVDEFMARQRERQSSAPTIVGEAVAQVKNIPPSEASNEKVKKPKQLKADLDDELQGIDIVFDGEESEPDDKLPFPQPDDNLQLSNQVGQSPPHSIVGETDSDAHGSGQFSRMGTPMASNVDDNALSEFSSRMSASRLERPLTREPSVTSEKKFFDPLSEQRDMISSSLEATSRISPHRSYTRHGMQGSHDHKYFQNQPPLPPMRPPMISSVVSSQAPDFIPHQKSAFPMESSIAIPTSFQAQSEYLSALNKSSLNQSMRPLPPLPPNPPPFASNPYNVQSLKASTPLPSVYGQTGIGATEIPLASLGSSAGARPASYPQPPLVPPMVFNRPVSVQGTLYGNPQLQPFGESNSPNVMSSLPFSQSSIQTIQTISQLQPLQPPLHVPQSPQPPRPSTLLSQQSDQQGLSLQGLAQLQMHSLQSAQQSQQVSPMHPAYMKPQQQVLSSSHGQPQHEAEPAQPPQVLHQHAESSNQQKDSGISLYDYFKSPEGIQALLSDREKLCQLLEQHPKLMQMLQERLGQL